ncbi:MAG: cadherin-like domain-containing protein [Solirubrobacterales bacterium]
MAIDDRHDDEHEHENNNNAGDPKQSQQALDDLTVLSDVGNQDMGQSRLNVARPVDFDEGKLGSLATVHQGSTSAPQVQTLSVAQTGEIASQDIAIDSASGTTEVAAVDTLHLEASEGSLAADLPQAAAPALKGQEDLSSTNIVFGDPIPTTTEDLPTEQFVAQEMAAPAPVEAPVAHEAAAVAERIITAPVIHGIKIDDPTTTEYDPQSVEGPATGKEDSKFYFQVDATDADGDNLTYSFSDPTHGTIKPDPDHPGGYIYIPETDWNGTDQFIVTVRDEHGNITTQVIDVNITADADAPLSLGSGTATGTEDQSISLDLKYDLAQLETLDKVEITGAPDGSVLHVGTVDIVAENGTFTITREQLSSVATTSDGNVVTLHDVSLTPAPDYNGSFDLNVTATSLDGTDTESSTSHIAVNVAPDAIDVSVELPGGSDGTPPVVSQDGSLEGDIDTTEPTITYGVVDPETGKLEQTVTTEHGTVTINPATGEFEYKPTGDMRSLDDGETLPDSFTIGVTDGKVTTTQQVDVTIAGSNDAPEVTTYTHDMVPSHEMATSEDSVVQGQAVATDVDTSDQDKLSYWLLDENDQRVDTLVTDHGTVHIDTETGTYTFEPNTDAQTMREGDTASDSFRVVAFDGDAISTPQDIGVTISGTNDLPTVSVEPIDLGSVGEDGAIVLTKEQLLAGAGDIEDGSNLDIDNLQVTHGTIEQRDDGAYVFHPDANYSGAVSVSFDVVDQDGGRTPASANLTVAETDIDHVDAGNVIAGSEGTAVTFSAKDLLGDSYDADATLAVSNVTIDGHVVAADENGNFTYNPGADFSGKLDVSFDVTSSDGITQSSSATVHVSETDIDHVDAGNVIAGSEGTQVTFTAADLLGDSYDADATLSVSNVTIDGHVVAADENGNFTYDPGSNFSGNLDVSFDVTSSDGITQSSSATVQVAETDIDHVDAGQVFEASEGTPVTFSAKDLLGDSYDANADLSVTNVTIDGHVVAADENGNFTYDPGSDFSGNLDVSFDVSSSDGITQSSSATVQVAETDIDHVDAGQVFQAQEGSPVTFTAADLLGDSHDAGSTLSVSNVTIDGHVVAADENGNFTYNPGADFSGKLDVSYDVTSSEGITQTSSATVQVAETDIDHVDAGVTIAGTEDTRVTFTAADLLGDSHDAGANLSVSDVTINGQIVAPDQDGNYTFTPPADFHGNVEIDYTVTSSDGISTQNSATLEIASVNDDPTAGDVTLKGGTEDTSVIISKADLLANATDIDGGTLSAADIHATHGTIVDNGNGTITFTPEANYHGEVSFTYTVEDGQGGHVSGTATMDLASVNDAPTVTGSVNLGSADNEGAVTFTKAELLGNAIDVEDGKDLSVANVSADNGTLVDNHDGTYTFTPGENFSGTVNVSYDVVDKDGGYTRDSAHLQVVDTTDDVPLAQQHVAITGTREDQSITYTVQSVDNGSGGSDLYLNDGHGHSFKVASDADDKLSVTGLTADHGSFTDNHNGTFTFTPTHDYSGSVNVTATVSDGTYTTTATAEMKVEAVADKPTLSASFSDTTTTSGGHIGTVGAAGNTIKIYADAEKDGAPMDVYIGDTKVGSFSVAKDGDFKTFTLDHVDNSLLTGGGALKIVSTDGGKQINVDKVEVNGVTIEAETGTTIKGANIHDGAVKLAGKDSAVSLDLSSHITGQTETHTLTVNSHTTDSDGSEHLSINIGHLDGATVGYSGNEGTLVHNADGSYTFNTNEHYDGSVSFTVTDGKGEEIKAQVTAEATDGSDTSDTQVWAVSDSHDTSAVPGVTISGGGGADNIQGTSGDDLLLGGKGGSSGGGSSGGASKSDDVINGGDGNDVIYGDAKMSHGKIKEGSGGGNDTLNGGAGNDVIHAGGGNDVVDGGTGNDTIDGGKGNDVLNGGDGDDTFLFDFGQGHDVVHGGSGSDWVDVSDMGNDFNLQIQHADGSWTDVDLGNQQHGTAELDPNATYRVEGPGDHEVTMDHVEHLKW